VSVENVHHTSDPSWRLLACEGSVATCAFRRSRRNWTTKTNATGSPAKYWSPLSSKRPVFSWCITKTGPLPSSYLSCTGVVRMTVEIIWPEIILFSELAWNLVSFRSYGGTLSEFSFCASPTSVQSVALPFHLFPVTSIPRRSSYNISVNASSASSCVSKYRCLVLPFSRKTCATHSACLCAPCAERWNLNRVCVACLCDFLRSLGCTDGLGLCSVGEYSPH
jgi:hypothetical protein